MFIFEMLATRFVSCVGRKSDKATRWTLPPDYHDKKQEGFKYAIS